VVEVDEEEESEESAESEDSRDPPAVITTAAAITAAVAEVNFYITQTIGGDSSSAPIVGEADEVIELAAEAGMDFAVVFETADDTMTWTPELDYGVSASFLTRVAVTDTGVTDGDVTKFMASYLVDSPLTNTDDLTADLTFTFAGDGLDYQYRYEFSIGAVPQDLVTVNTLVVGPVVVEEEEESSKGFPWLWVILGIIIVGAILYFFVL